MTGPSAGASHVTELRGVRCEEIFLITSQAGQLTAAVYNTTGLNDYPPAAWRSLDPHELAKDFGVPAVHLNDPRFWTLLRAASSLSCALGKASPDRACCASGNLVASALAALAGRIAGLLPWRSERLGERDHHVQGGGERPGVPFDLRQQQAALERREHGGGELVGVGGRDELAAVAHAVQAGTDRRLPAAEARGDVVPGHVVELGEFAAERSERAAALAARVFLDRDDRVPPGPQAVDSLDRGQHRLVGLADHGLGAVVNYGAHQRLLVGEVVVDLRAAHPGLGPDLLQGGAGDALLQDEVGSCRHDLLPRLRALAGQSAFRPPGAGVARHELTLPVLDCIF